MTVEVVVAGDRGKKAEREISTGGFLTDTPAQWLAVARFRLIWIIHGGKSWQNVNPNWFKWEIYLMVGMRTFCKGQSMVAKNVFGLDSIWVISLTNFQADNQSMSTGESFHHPIYSSSFTSVGFKRSVLGVFMYRLPSRMWKTPTYVVF